MAKVKIGVVGCGVAALNIYLPGIAVLGEKVEPAGTGLAAELGWQPTT